MNVIIDCVLKSGEKKIVLLVTQVLFELDFETNFCIFMKQNCSQQKFISFSNISKESF